MTDEAANKDDEDPFAGMEDDDSPPLASDFKPKPKLSGAQLADLSDFMDDDEDDRGATSKHRTVSKLSGSIAPTHQSFKVAEPIKVVPVKPAAPAFPNQVSVDASHGVMADTLL